jgi:hypothetical protein
VAAVPRPHLCSDEQEAEDPITSVQTVRGVPAPVRVKLKRAERLPGLGVTPQRDGPTSDGGRPCPAGNQRTHQQIVEAARYCQPALSARTTRPGRLYSGLSKGEQL